MKIGNVYTHSTNNRTFVGGEYDGWQATVLVTPDFLQKLTKVK